jgi:hypothetical protein
VIDALRIPKSSSGATKSIATMNIIESTQIAFFQHFGATGENVPLSKMLKDIKGNKWKGQVDRLRAKGREAVGYDEAKKKLPAFMLSGTTAGGHKAADVIKHSGLLQIDVDKVGAEHAANLRDRIGDDRHILAAWISPSGDGVKAILRIPASVSGHKAAFAAAVDYMRETFGVEIDEKCSDVGRLCFVSHDPALVDNLDAVSLEVATVPKAPACPDNSSESLNAESCVLCNNDLFLDFPDLKPIYFKLVHGRIGKPQRGERNAAMVEIVASMFCVVSPFFVLAFADEFYRQHAEVFSDYDFKTYQRQALKMLDGCHTSYPLERLNAGERAAYAALPDENSQTAFRITQSLSQCESNPDFPPPTFFLSYEELRIRLKVFRNEAWRTMKKLEKAGIVRREKNGTRWTKGSEPPSASEWRWML